jgi:Cu/Ag efflux pump CusA
MSNPSTPTSISERIKPQTPLDAIPDLSDVQVIVYADWDGRAPELVVIPVSVKQ